VEIRGARPTFNLIVDTRRSLRTPFKKATIFLVRWMGHIPVQRRLRLEF
jgi:hypothetical protein